MFCCTFVRYKKYLKLSILNVICVCYIYIRIQKFYYFDVTFDLCFVFSAINDYNI